MTVVGSQQVSPYTVKEIILLSHPNVKIKQTPPCRRKAGLRETSTVCIIKDRIQLNAYPFAESNYYHTWFDNKP